MPSKHYTDIKVTRLTSENACLANGGPWCVEYRRDGVAKSNGFHTASVATAFATQLETGRLDNLSRPADAISDQQAHFLMRQALEVIATRADLSPAVMVMLARDALAKVAKL